MIIDFPVWDIFKKIFAKGAVKSVELLVVGGALYWGVSSFMASEKNDIVKQVTKVINKGDSVTQQRVNEVGMNNNYNTILTIERVSRLEDTIYHDNKKLRKENQKLLNDKYKLLQEKTILYDVKKNETPYSLLSKLEE